MNILSQAQFKIMTFFANDVPDLQPFGQYAKDWILAIIAIILMVIGALLTLAFIVLGSALIYYKFTNNAEKIATWKSRVIGVFIGAVIIGSAATVSGIFSDVFKGWVGAN